MNSFLSTVFENVVNFINNLDKITYEIVETPPMFNEIYQNESSVKSTTEIVETHTFNEIYQNEYVKSLFIVVPSFLLVTLMMSFLNRCYVREYKNSIKKVTERNDKRNNRLLIPCKITSDPWLKQECISEEPVNSESESEVVEERYEYFPSPRSMSPETVFSDDMGSVDYPEEPDYVDENNENDPNSWNIIWTKEEKTDILYNYLMSNFIQGWFGSDDDTWIFSEWLVDNYFYIDFDNLDNFVVDIDLYVAEYNSLGINYY
jgi:hypothetical protein